MVGGLPATGKSTVAGALVRRTGFTFVRVDRIEQAIIGSGELRPPLGPVGYTVAYDLAAEQLKHGVNVVAECVNPLAVTRNAWRDVAAGHGARLVEVELICTNLAAHRERVRTREVDIPGLKLPDWQQIASREYEPWDRDHLVIDTATRTSRGRGRRHPGRAAGGPGSCSSRSALAPPRTRCAGSRSVPFLDAAGACSSRIPTAPGYRPGRC